MTRTLAVAVVLVLGLAGAGCIIPRFSHGRLKGAYVLIPHGHVHSARCGHYYSGGGWLVLDGHVHGDGCGHCYRGGNWCDDD